VAGGVSLSSDVIRKCAEAGIPISFVSKSGRPYARIISAGLTGTVKTRREQLLAYENGRSVVLGKAFAEGKLRNQINLLKYMAKYRKRREKEIYQEVQIAISEIKKIIENLKKLDAENIDALRLYILNLEGRGAQIYWETIQKLLKTDVNWPGRRRRGAKDLVNSLLNYGYGILYTQIERAILLAGLDPYAGFLHVDRPGKPSLVLDLIEEFRQMIADRVIFGLLNRRANLAVDDKGYLTEHTRKLTAKRVLERLEGEERYEGKKRKLRTIIQSQAYHIATFVRGERPSYKPFVGGW
jgi:CRISPR-associated protein Cas1